MAQRKTHKAIGSAGLYVLLYAALIFCALVTLVPFAYLVCASLKPSAIFFDNLFLPGGDGPLGIGWDQLNLDHFRRLFVKEGFARHLLNSTFFASVSGVLATLFSAMSGYALAKFRFRGRDGITNLALAALVVPGALLLAPNYQLLYWFGMLDSYTGLIVPALAPAFGVYLFRQATVNSVPNEMLESARIDGCGEIKIFFTFVLPLIRPMAGAFLLLTFLGSWNNFIGAQIVLQTPEKMPLAVAINQLRGTYGTDYGLIMAGTVVSILPVLALFLLLQKEFLSGLTSGAVKG
jgi:arabinooligosaccharide transport system permease protein